MNEFKRSVKQDNKKVFAVVVIAIAAFILCFSASMIAGIGKAQADPSLQETLDRTSNEYINAQNAQAEAQAKVDEAEATIAECEREIPATQAKLNGRVKSMYVNKDFGEVLNLVLGATSINELVNNLEYISIVNQKDAELVTHCRNLKLQVEAEKASLDANLAEANAQAAAAADAYERAQSALNASRQQGGGGGGYTPTKPAEYLGDVVATAYACKGYPYVWAAAGPYGFDCSGLVSWCYGGGGSHIFTTDTFMTQSSGFHRIDASQAAPGDVVSTWSHCGIYIGGGMMIHAPTEGDVVKEAGVQGGMEYFTRR